ncbi:MAG: hypothetical protein GX333_01660, partial [Syntrophomonadaceae bacterium]|nr:hypothetical protein [Syntrophomonadaceae bacterium]
AKAFLFFKAAAAVTSVITSVTEAIYLLTGAQWALNTAMNANPVGIVITLVGLLLMWIIKLTGGFENLEDIGEKAWLALQIAFLTLVEKIVWGVKKILDALSFLLGWIPGIGTAIKKAANVAEDALEGLRWEIGETIDELDRLNNMKVAPKIVDTSSVLNELGDGVTYEEYERKVKEIQDRLKRNAEMEQAISVPKNLGQAGAPRSTGTTRASTSRPKTIHDRIREIGERHSPDIDLYQTRADLAERRDDTKAVKENRNLIVEALRRQASDLLDLQKSATGRDAKIVEAERNKILLKIEDVLDEINEGVNRIVGGFNIPSNFRALTEYQYRVSRATNTLSKRMVFAPNVDMYLTIEDTGERGVAQVRNEIGRFTNAIFDDKNDLVAKFMQDVTRN